MNKLELISQTSILKLRTLQELILRNKGVKFA